MPRTSQPTSGLGIEDELSFGSDEDLLADVGEISIAPAAMSTTASGKPEKKSGSRFKLGSGKKKPEDSVGTGAGAGAVAAQVKDRERKEKKDSRHLSKAALVLEPHMESVLDLTNQGSYSRSSGSASGSTPSLSIQLPSAGLGSTGGQKRRGIRSTLMGLGMKKGDQAGGFGGGRTTSGGARTPQKMSDKLYAVRSIESYTTADLSPQQSIDTYSTRRTDYTASSVHTHHLAHTSASPVKTHRQGSLTDNSTIASKHTSISSFAPRASVTTSIGTTHIGTVSPVPSHKDKNLLGLFPEAPLEPKQLSPSKVSNPTSASFESGPESDALLAVLLPSFPAALQALENIQILSATVIRRSLAALPEKEGRGARPFSGLGVVAAGTPGAGGKRRVVWTTQQMVLTSFKIGGSSPAGSPALGRPAPEPSSSRTIAHLHLFSVPASSGTSGSASGSPVKVSSAGPVELERMMIKAASTAGVWDESMVVDRSGAGEAKRKCVMRVGYGAGGAGEGSDSEWVVEMRNVEQLQEWIRQIKSIAILVRAEQEGHGEAIRTAYNTGTVHSDALALTLNMERGNPAPRSSVALGVADLPQAPSSSTGTLSLFPTTAGMERGASELSAVTARSAARAESPDLLGQERELEGAGEGLDEDLRGRLERFDMSSTPVPPRRDSETSSSPAATEMQASHGRKPSLPLSLTTKTPSPPPTTPPTAPLPALPAHAQATVPEAEPATAGMSEAELVRFRANEQRATAPGQGPSLAPEVRHDAGGENEQTTPTSKQEGTVPAPLSVPPAGGSASSLLAADAQSMRSIPSVSSTPSTTTSRRRNKRMMAVDIMAEFNESGAADYEVEGEDELVEDRPRVIRFA